MLDSQHGFTCCRLNLYHRVVKFQNIFINGLADFQKCKRVSVFSLNNFFTINGIRTPLPQTLITSDIHLREKCPHSEFFWSIFFCIWAKYVRISPYSAQMEKTPTRKTPNTDTFHVVINSNKGFRTSAGLSPNLRNSDYYKSQTFQYQSTVSSNRLSQIFSALQHMTINVDNKCTQQ